jgi:hypothetical protein
MNTTNQTIDSILKQSIGIDREEALKDISLLIAIAKRDRYAMECQRFEKKYNMKFKVFEKSLRKVTGEEDYQKENDLDDWEFAISSQNWWQQKIEALTHVSK